jgi:DisA bacterial checkpoint controller nucleotide-binding
MEYPIHTYPRDLARQVALQWAITPDASNVLPPEEAIASLLSEAYQASLLREEGRSVICRLILIDPARLNDTDGPPAGLQVLRLAQERTFRENEIRRLSPSATLYRSFIGIRWDVDKGFLVWGIINSGTRWVNETDGGRLRSPAVPKCLIIHVRAPGNLVIFRGDQRIATLLNGKLQGHGFHIFEASWLRKRQEEFARWAIRECFKNHQPGAAVTLDFTQALGENFTKRVISQVRHGRHGGTLIITLPGGEKLVHASGPIRPKYWVSESKARYRYRDLIFAVMRTLSAVGAEHGLKAVGWREYQELKDDRLAELDEAIFEFAHLLADLMAVDGALVLTAARDIIGFGAEIHVAIEQNEVIYRALDINGQQVVEDRADDGGTRHRAAYRLSRTHPECMVIVVSQDGSVRYVGNQNGRVTYWDVLSF